MKIRYLPENGVIDIQGSISVFEILSVIGFVVIIISVFAALRAYRHQHQVNRANFSLRFWQEFMSEDAQSAFLEIEWGKFRYPVPNSANGFASPEQERRIDKLLYLLDELALLLEQGLLSDQDERRWEYQAKRVYQNEAIKNYLGFLDGFFETNQVRQRPHHHGRKRFAD